MTAKPDTLVSIIGWAVLAGLSVLFLAFDQILVLAVVAAGLLRIEGFARAMNDAVVDAMANHAERAGNVRVAGLVFRFIAIGSALSAFAVLATPYVSSVLLMDPRPLLLLSLLGGLRFATSAPSAIIRFSGHQQAQMIVSIARAITATVVSIALLMEAPTVSDLMVGALAGEFVALLLGGLAAFSVHDNHGWDLKLGPAILPNEFLRSTGIWLPLAVTVSLLARESTQGLLTPGWLVIVDHPVVSILFAALIGVSVALQRLAPPAALAATSMTVFAVSALWFGLSIPTLVGFAIVCLTIPVSLRLHFRTDHAALALDDPTGDMSIIVTYSDPDLPILSMLSAVATQASKSWVDYEIIAVALGPVGGQADRIEALKWRGLRHVRGDIATRGDATRSALSSAQGSRVALVDLDARGDVVRLPHYASLLDEFGLDAVIGSRKHPRSIVASSSARVWISRAYIWWCCVVVDRRLGDSGGGVKLFRTEAVRRVLPLSTVRGSHVEVELLGLLRRHDALMAEAAVVLPVSPGLPSVSDVLSQLFGTAWVGLRIRLQSGVT